MNATESETFDKCRKAEEKIEKIKLKLDQVIVQIDTIFLLYIDVLACRSPTTNNALFLLEEYLLLKIKCVVFFTYALQFVS